MTKKKKEKFVEKSAAIKVEKKAIDPKDAKIKKLRGIISDLCHAIDVQREYQSKVKCFECNHFIKEAYDKAVKI